MTWIQQRLDRTGVGTNARGSGNEPPGDWERTTGGVGTNTRGSGNEPLGEWERTPGGMGPNPRGNGNAPPGAPGEGGGNYKGQRTAKQGRRILPWEAELFGWPESPG